MGATGLLLIGFLIAHLSANLLILFDQEAFNHYGHTLTSNPLIYVAELGLLLMFGAHLISGLINERRNRAARPIAYANKQDAGGSSRKTLASATMIFSGVLVAVFVPLHIWGFKYGAWYPSAGDPAVRDLSRLVIEEFRSPLLVIWYVAVMVVLGFHAFHGIASAFESLGVSYRAWLRSAGRALAVIIFGGFVAIPIIVYFFMGGAS